MKGSKLFILMFLGILLGCTSPSSLSLAELKQWVNDPDNGLCMIKELGDFRLTALYKPADYLIASEHKTDTENPEIFKNQLQEANRYYHFTLRIDCEDRNKEFLKAGIQNQQEYYERLRYYTSDIQQDLLLVSGKDTLPCVFSHFERIYQLSSYGDILLSFEKPATPAKQSNLVLIYNDKMLGLGPVHFTYPSDKIQQAPKLKI